MKREKGKLFLYTIVSVIALCISGKFYNKTNIIELFCKELRGESFIGLFILIAILVVYNSVWDRYRKNRKIIMHIVSVLFALFMIIGLSFSENGSLGFVLGSGAQMLISLVVFAGYYCIFDVAITILYVYLDGMNLKCTNINFLHRKKVEKNFFLIVFATLSICWLPYLLVNLPGSVPYDGYRQINMFYGVEKISNHHPWLITMFIGLFMALGRHISDNFGVFLVVTVFFILEALCYAGVCSKLKKWEAPDIICIGTIIYFAIVPSFGAYAQVVIKDGLFSAVFALYIAYYIECFLLKRQGALKNSDVYKQMLWIFVLSFLVCITRNNGIYMVLPANIVLIFLWQKKQRYSVICMLFCLLISFCGIDKGLSSYLGVLPGSAKEMLSIPFQQTARYVTKYSDEVTEEEKDAINNVLQYDNLKEAYQPEISDHVKDSFKNPEKEEVMEYFKVWLKMFFKHPIVYFEATFHNSYGYYYPFYNFQGLSPYQFYIQDEPIATGKFDIHYVTPEGLRNSFLQYTLLWRKIPGTAQLVNPGTYTWLLLLLAGYIIFKKKWRKNLVLIGPFLNVAICIASPVNGYVCYALPLMSCMPILIYWGLCVIDE